MIQENMQLKQAIDLLLSLKSVDHELNKLSQDFTTISLRIQNLETQVQHNNLNNPIKREFKKKRRTADLVERGYPCPYEKCLKVYGTEISLNLHIRLKHNGGSKIEREEVAVIQKQQHNKQQQIIIAKFKNEEPPTYKINLPPNFLDEFCQTYSEFTKNLEQTYNKKLQL